MRLPGLATQGPAAALRLRNIGAAEVVAARAASRRPFIESASSDRGFFQSGI